MYIWGPVLLGLIRVCVCVGGGGGGGVCFVYVCVGGGGGGPVLLGLFHKWGIRRSNMAMHLGRGRVCNYQ